MKIRQLKLEDYERLASIHKSAFSDFFLSSLGLQFLEIYYKSCLSEPTSIAVGIVDEQENVIGFATGTLKAKGYHKRLFFKNIFSFLRSIARSAIANPQIIYRLIKNIEKKPNDSDKKDYAELLSIAVLPELKGSGAGKALLESFEQEVKVNGTNRIALTTDYNNNERVIAFYQKFGYEIFYDFTTYPKRRMYKMIKNV